MTELDYELWIWVTADDLYLMHIVAMGTIAAWLLGSFIYESVREAKRYWPSKDFMADVL